MVEVTNRLIDEVFKILPLYEEENESLGVYIESLRFKVEGMETLYETMVGDDYLQVLLLLSSLEKEGKKQTYENQPVMKREVFKCIHLLKRMKRGLVYE